jgi:hypothetical protein
MFKIQHHSCCFVILPALHSPALPPLPPPAPCTAAGVPPASRRASRRCHSTRPLGISSIAGSLPPAPQPGRLRQPGWRSAGRCSCGRRPPVPAQVHCLDAAHNALLPRPCQGERELIRNPANKVCAEHSTPQQTATPGHWRGQLCRLTALAQSSLSANRCSACRSGGLMASADGPCSVASAMLLPQVRSPALAGSCSRQHGLSVCYS